MDKKPEQVNFIIGIFGKKGSGKTYLTENTFLKKLDRYIVLDTLKEYKSGIIIDNIEDLKNYLLEKNRSKFKIIFRHNNDYEAEKVFQLSRVLNNFTLIIEEVDYYCDTHNINEDILYNIRYGRHFGRNLLWICRSPYEINRFLSRQTDMIITFKQTEPRDIDYLNKYNFNKDFTNLQRYEYAFSLSDSDDNLGLTKRFNILGVKQDE